MCAQPTVLVIEDDEPLRKTLCENLEGKGFQLIEAENGNEGLRVIRRSGAPSVVVKDLFMSEKEGIEVIQFLQKEHPKVKIIAISGGYRSIESSNVLEAAKAMGASVILEKPLDFDELETHIKGLLEKNLIQKQ